VLIDSGAVKEAFCGGGEATSVHAGGRRRSSGDFDFYSPGDLLSHAQRDAADASTGKKRPVPPLLKRNTIADFANTRAYQESTASLISATDQGVYAGPMKYLPASPWIYPPDITPRENLKTGTNPYS